MVINIDFRSSEMPPLPNNGIFKLICWMFADALNQLVTSHVSVNIKPIVIKFC